MRRVLIVTNDFPPRAGGIQAFVHSMATRLGRDRVVVYAANWHDEREVRRFDAAQPFPVIRDSASLLLPTPRVGRKAAELLRAEGCESVWFGAAAPIGLLAPRLRAAGADRLVGTTHGHEIAWSRIPGANVLMHRIGEEVDVLTYLGEYTRSRISKALSPRAAARMVRLTPGVDDTTFRPGLGKDLRERLGLTDVPVVVCVSRLVPRKGQDTLIRALPEIRRRMPGTVLLIVGGGPHRGSLERLVDSTGVRDAVRFAGEVPWENLPEHFAAGDVFAMPCRTRHGGLDVEGLGIVYLEASAAGLPVVAGDSGGAPDAVLDGETGYVVRGRSVAQTADRVATLLADADLRARMGERGRSWVERNWRWDTLAVQLADLLWLDPVAAEEPREAQGA